MKPRAGETLDSIKDIRLFQSKKGYRFSIDAVLLENFIDAKRLQKGVELGTGSGVISILLATRLSNIQIKAVELQKSLAGRAGRNVILNGLEDSVEIISKDIKDLKKEFHTNEFDIAFSNPPFRKPRTGRISIDKERAIARHEIEIGLVDLIRIAAYLLKHSGKFYLIYHPFRLAELISMLHKSKLEPKRMKFIHSRSGGEAKMVLIEAVKGSGAWLKIEPPLYLYESGKTYTREVLKMLDKA